MEGNLENLKGKSWVAAMSLCWLFGALGAHRFYTGKSTTAWVMFILSILGVTAPISAIWAFVDGVMLTLGNYTHEDGSELYERVPWFGWTYIIIYILTALIVLLSFSAIVTASIAAMKILPSILNGTTMPVILPVTP